MKKTIILGLASLMLFTPVVHAQQGSMEKFSEKSQQRSPEKYSQKEKEFSNWVSYYYLNPEPEKIPEAIKFYCKAEMYKHDTAAWPLAVFFSDILKKNPKQLDITYKEISSGWSKRQKTVLLRMLWVMKTKKSKAYIEELTRKDRSLKKVLKEIEEADIPGIWLGPVESPLELDMLWAYFFATGTDRAVKRLVFALNYFKPGHGRFMTGGASFWSLSANGYQHKRVYEILTAELEALKESEKLNEEQKHIKGMLEKIVTQVAKRLEEEGEFDPGVIKF